MRDWNRALWPRLSALFDRALDLPASDRHALVTALRATDAELAAALEQLLAEHEHVVGTDFLENSAIAPAPAASLAGQTLGGYTLERPVGAGGMGAVWLARRSDGRFEGLAAIKFINLALLDRAGQERFRREGTLLARLAHPHIARLLDAGITPGGQPFLVLEYVEGLSIDVYAAAHRLTLPARLDLFLQVADAVAHAHANLVVHRDIKPSNVLVNAGGDVKLLDFGVAMLVDAGSPDAAPSIAITSRALTPEYAAPEQIDGGPITTATDVYALGVLLYRLLVGCHPTAQPGATHATALRALAEREPLRLSETALRLPTDPEGSRILAERQTTAQRLRRVCRGDLDTIVDKALKKAAGERYQTVTAFADDLRHYLHHEPVEARPDSVWYRGRRFVTRHRVEFAAAAAVGLALIVGTGLALGQARTSARARDRALDELHRAEATNEFSSFLLSQARPAGAPISNKELLARGETLIDKRFAGDPVLRVHLLLTLADRYQENQQFDDWRRTLQRAYDLSRPLDDAALRARAACAWGQQFAEAGNATRALEVIDAAERELPEASEYADAESRCLVFESISAKIGGDAARAIASAERALAIEEAEVSHQRGASGRMLDTVAALASAYAAGYDYANGDRAYRRSIELLDREGMSGSLDAAVMLNNWSVMLQDSGRYLAAADVSARAVHTARAADSEHGASLSMLSTYGTALSAIGDHPHAVAAFEEALEKARTAGSSRRLISLLSHAIVEATDVGDADRAAVLLAEAERARATDRSPYSKGLIEASAARVALARDDIEGAATLAARAVATLETATPNRASLVPTLTLLARTLNAQRQFDRALATAERSLAMARQRLTAQPHSYAIGQALVELATAKDGLGDRRASLDQVALALEHLNATVGAKAPSTMRAAELRSRISPAVSR